MEKFNTQPAKVRILHIVHSLNPGGMENGVVNIINGLPETDFFSSVACIAEKGAFSERLSQSSPVFAMDKTDGVNFKSAKKLATIIESAQPSLIHTHNLGPLIYTCLAKIASRKIRRIPILHGEHAQLHGRDRTVKRMLLRKTLYRCTTATHSVSESLTSHLKELGLPCKKMHSIINGVDTTKFCPSETPSDSKISLKIPHNAWVIGYVARFAPFKRHVSLLQAFESVAKKTDKAHLLLVGSGGDAEEEIHAIVNSHPYKERIHLAGYQKNPAPYYHAMDLHVMPSVHEGLSNAILESMASGVPSMLHPACGATEVISDNINGFVRSLDSPRLIADNILELMEDDASLKATGENARQTAVERFSLNTMVSNYARIYRNYAC